MKVQFIASEGAEFLLNVTRIEKEVWSIFGQSKGRIIKPNCDLTYQCLMTPLDFLTVFVFKEFLYKSSLSVV